MQINIDFSETEQMSYFPITWSRTTYTFRRTINVPCTWQWYLWSSFSSFNNATEFNTDCTWIITNNLKSHQNSSEQWDAEIKTEQQTTNSLPPPTFPKFSHHNRNQSSSKEKFLLKCILTLTTQWKHHNAISQTTQWTLSIIQTLIKFLIPTKKQARA